MKFGSKGLSAMSFFTRIIATVLLLGSFVLARGAQPSLGSSALPEEAKVLLPDGSLLVTGGKTAAGATDRAYVIALDGSRRTIRGGMKSPRAGHTLTVLPNGKVLVLGGIGNRGNYVRTMEVFDPATATFSVCSGAPLVPRADHTATLLSNGLVAVVGGSEEGGALARDLQLWDFRTGAINSMDLGLQVPRAGATATLDFNGAVLVTGGHAANDSGRIMSELMTMDPISFQTLSMGTEPAPDDTASRVERSEPLDGASSVPLDQYIKLRFGRLVLPTTFSTATVTLRDANGNSVPGSASLAESGRLGFFLPTGSLSPGMTYTLEMSGLSDMNGTPLPSFTASFQTVVADDDGSEDGWIPSAQALNGNWNSGTGLSSMQKLPPLQAGTGVTAVAGQALAVSGKPLARVTLTIEGKSVKTDDTGRFLLEPVASGHHIMTIDGSTANKRRASYGFFETGIDVKAGMTNVLNYTIWLTRLDAEHTVTIPSPTTDADTIVKTPLIPGLELHLPAGTRIISRDGKPETKLTITPIPLDKPPFPLPTGLKVPFYFTIQPGGAEIRVPGSGANMKGARLFYPNGFHEPVGTVYNFWNYDAASKGWYIYGNGEVIKPGMQIVPDAGVFVYELTGAMVGGANAKPAIGPGPDGPSDGDPVDLASGQFIYHNTDLALPDLMPISLERTYITNDHYSRAFGVGTTDNYDMFMVGDTAPWTYQELVLPNGAAVRFNRVSAGTSYTDALYQSTALNGYWYGSTLWFNQSNSNGFPFWHWLLKTKSGITYIFPNSTGKNDQVHQALVGIVDPHGNSINLTRDNNALLTRISSPSGRFIEVNYDASQRIAQAIDSSGRTVSYSYDSANRLTSVTDVNGGVTSFAYNNLDLLTGITDPRGTAYLANLYDSYGRVVQQTQADNGTYTFSWIPSQNSTQLWTSSGSPVNRYSSTDYEGYTGLISQVTVTSPRGYTRQVSYDNLGRPVNVTSAFGQPEQQAITYQYYADNLLKSVTDSIGRTTSVDYDANSNITSITALSGTAGATTSQAAYDPTWNRLTSATDSLGHTSTYTYNNVGDVVRIQNALGKAVTIGYDSFGRATSITDPMGDTSQFTYSGPDLVSTADPLGNISYRFSDNRGNVVSVVDANGNRTKFVYDSSNRVVSATDALGNSTSHTYDLNGNLVRVQDKGGNTTSYVYDAMNRLTTIIDPLQRIASITYDLDGNIASKTDHKGQTINKAYDGLGRKTFVGYGAQSGQSGPTYQNTVSYTYDGADRLTQATDSITGTVTRVYDNMDHIHKEKTSSSSVTYGYDLGGRRTSMQVGTASPITYGYDAADKVISVDQGSSQTEISYDDAGRRNTVTFSNGMIASYVFDKASHLQSLVYSQNGSTLGSLSYNYDSAGLRVAISGNLAATSLPVAVSSASYDGANQLTSWNGLSATYDANGSTLTDISGNQYTWDARNLLTSVSGSLNLSFSYDAFARRTGVTSGGQATVAQYDGFDRVSSTSSTYSQQLLTGGTDEYFEFTDPNATTYPITDALGSKLALANQAGQFVTNYRYEPFGKASESGAIDANINQFAGRENDLDGLYYDRARYYNPTTGRFISQDPAGFAGGLNPYRYANDNPISFNDPSGLDPSPGQQGPGHNPLWCLLFGCDSPGRPSGPKNPGIPGAPGLGPHLTGPSPSGPNPGKGPMLCGGYFSFEGIETDIAEAGGFSGTIAEHDSVSGDEYGNLSELWAGGEVADVGFGKVTGLHDKSPLEGIFGFVGTGLSAGPLAGAQIGYIESGLGPTGVGGVYIESHIGEVAYGTGAYVSNTCSAR